MNHIPQQHSVVVKVGSSSITDADGRISESVLATLVDGLVDLLNVGANPILVSSGAIAAGRAVIRLGPKVAELADLQGLAAVGQGALMATYTRLLAARGVLAGQVLLTSHDFGDRLTYLNMRATMRRLLKWGVIPVINENDTTSTDEITLGDNDRLSALVATLVGAKLLVILTDTAGFFAQDPRVNQEAELIEEILQIDAALEKMAGGPGRIGTGGMATKLAAAKIASWSGTPCVIAHAHEVNVLIKAWSGEPVGTRVHARSRSLSAKKVWIAFARQPTGTVSIDMGAVRALTLGGHSLLSVGITGAQGSFLSGDVVDVVDSEGSLVAKGVTRASYRDLQEALSDRCGDGNASVVVHRDDMVVLNGR